MKVMKYKNIIRLFVFLFLLTSIIYNLTSGVNAQVPQVRTTLEKLFTVNAQDTSPESAGFSVSPPSFEINALPGNSIKNTIKVENLSDVTLKIKTKAQNFVAYGEGGQVNLTDEKSPFAIASWIKIAKKEQIIPSKGSALFDFEINIPKNADPGSHYGAVVFYTEGAGGDGTGAAVSQEVGSLILIKLPGDVFEDAKLVSFKPDKNPFKEPKVKLLALLENTGNVHVKPYGFINITNVFGKKVKSYEVKGRNILPGSKRLFDEEFDFKPIGYFKADLTMLLPGGEKVMKGETEFVALNWLVLRKYLIVAGIVLLLYLLLHKRINRAIKVLLKG